MILKYTIYKTWCDGIFVHCESSHWSCWQPVAACYWGVPLQFCGDACGCGGEIIDVVKRLNRMLSPKMISQTWIEIKQLYWDISDMYWHSRLHRATLWAKQHPKTNHEQLTARRPYPNAATSELSKIFGSVHCPVCVHTEAWPIAESWGPLFDKMISFTDLPTKHWEWHGYVIYKQFMISWLGQCYGLWQIYTVDRWVDKAACTWWARLYRVYIPMIITTLQSICSVHWYEKNKEKDGDKKCKHIISWSDREIKQYFV